MTELLLIVTLAGQRLAIAAADVESVVEIEGLTPVPRAAAHIAGLAALRSRVVTVVDCYASLALAPAAPGKAVSDAIVIVADGHPYALLVDTVEDVIEHAAAVLPIRGELDGGWRRVARGMVEAGDDLILLVDSAALVAGPLDQAA